MAAAVVVFLVHCIESRSKKGEYCTCFLKLLYKSKHSFQIADYYSSEVQNM
jgi:hypothetical protein